MGRGYVVKNVGWRGYVVSKVGIELLGQLKTETVYIISIIREKNRVSKWHRCVKNPNQGAFR